MRFARFALLVAFTLSAFSYASNAATPLVVMSMGDSITVGVDYQTSISGGYRDPLYQDLIGMGIPFTFAGASTSNPTTALTASGQTHHNGYASWHIEDLDNNLDGVATPISGGDSNQGGYLVTGGHGTGRAAVYPDILLLHIGTNDLLQGTANVNQKLYSLVTHFHTLSPNTVILIAGIIPIDSGSFVSPVQAYNSYIKGTLVPALPYTLYVDQNTPLLNSDGSVNGDLLGTDLVHPNRYGYPILAYNWATAIKQVVGVKGTTYGLTVSGGKGTGSYAPGSILTVQANTPAGASQFSSWVPGTTALANPYAALTTYVMPASQSTLTTSYVAAGSPLVPDGAYQISGFFDGLSIATAGTTDASPVQQQAYAGAATQKWQVTNLGNNLITLTLAGTREALEVPSALASTVQANLDVSTYTGGTNQQWTVTPLSGATELVNAASGQAITVGGYATSPGSPLVQYTASGLNIEQWRFYPLTTAPATYSLTVNNGTRGGLYAAGSTVTVSANAPAQNYIFCGWSGATGSLANTSASTTTLSMPASTTTIAANFCYVQPTYSLTVLNGSGSGSYTAGSTVTVTANPAGGNQTFAGWTGLTSALANPSAATTTLTMPAAAASITASYVTFALAPAPPTAPAPTPSPAPAPSPSPTPTPTPAPTAARQVISVHFPQYYNHQVVTPMNGNNYTGGVVPLQNWNVADTDTGTNGPNVAPGALLDATGAATSLGFSFSGYTRNDGTNNRSFPQPIWYQTGGLTDAYIAFGSTFNTSGAPETLTLSGLNATHSYSLILYVAAPWWANGGAEPASLTAGVTTYYVQTSNSLSAWVQATSTTATTPTTGNYVQFSNLTGAAAQTITLRGSYVGLGGFQLIDNGVTTKSSVSTSELQ